jgi:hypothetical protein
VRARCKHQAVSSTSRFIRETTLVNQSGSKFHRLTQAVRKPTMSADPCRPRQTDSDTRRAHGLGANERLDLEPCAHAFAAGGYAVLLFDYRR